MTAGQTLKQYFGYDTFRNGQEVLINDILSHRDCLGIMPTGAGKSLCYQIPALMLQGITLIVSPLISLMKDQVNSLTQNGIKAAYINSSLTERQIAIALDRAANGEYKLIYVAPERLLSEGFIAFAQAAEISMLTVDEAHCISQWGQDFRPSYLKIPDFIASLNTRPIVSAFTATATERVRADIISLLRLNEPTVLVTGFDRSNLFFDVQKPKDKFRALTQFLQDKKDKSGIVYCATRATVEDVCENLKINGYLASRYHAGLPDAERHSNQDDFLYDRVRIMVATNAFGMGIDKSDVSFVVHYNMPKDIESYYQEAGRAGRDGGPADCLLLYSGQDVFTQQWMIDNAKDAEYPNSETEEAIKESNRRRLREMTFYATTNDCLRAYILKYFGETPSERCDNCGNCNTEFELADITVDAQKILSCVVRMNERYGMNTIIDVLRGSDNEKVLRLGLHKLSTYGICESTEKYLRDVFTFLLQNGYLIKTDDEYPIIKLGARARDVLRGGETVQMKLSSDPDTDGKARSSGKRHSVISRPMDKQLYARLRDLRHEIAAEQKVPAFVIFSDSALAQMSASMPVTKNAMLDVSGVGEVKFQRYGERFIKTIEEYIEGGGSNSSEAGSSAGVLIDPAYAESPSPFDASMIELSDDDITASVLSDRINLALMQSSDGSRYKRMSGQRLNDWLVSLGYLEVVIKNGKNFRVATSEGAELGITTTERLIRGEPSWVNTLSRNVQEFVITHILELLNHGV